MDSAIDIDKRMIDFANSNGSMNSIRSILMEGMSEREEQAFALGVRAGKHWAALAAMRALRTLSPMVGREIDLYMDSETL